MENMEAPLRRAERSLTLFVRNNRAHDCTLELAGVCSHCETYWDMRDEIEYEIMMEKMELAPFGAMQSKKNMACACRGVRADSLHASIVALALTINGQR
jgi:hypothetical protein